MSKIRVMLVDDEVLALEDLRDIYDWEENGFEIVGTANNGKNALTKYVDLMPDLVITDIKMPIMDGLELIEEIRKINTNTKILLLTAYSDFEFAKKAIKHGITDYLLKNEINQQTLSDKLKSIKVQLESESRISNLLSQKVILDIFNSRNRDKDYDMNFDESIEKFLHTPFYYFIVEEDLPLPIAGISHSNDFRSSSDVITCCNKLVLDGLSIICVGTIRANQVLVVIKNESNLADGKTIQLLMNAANQLKNKIAEFSNNSFTIYVVNNRVNLRDLKTLYYDNEKSFYKKFILGNGLIYTFLDKKLEWFGDEIKLDEIYVSSLIDKIEDKDLVKYLDSLYDKVLSGEADYNSFIRISQNLYRILQKYIESLPLKPYTMDISPSENEQYWLNAADIKKWMRKSFEELFIELQKILENKFSIEVVNAIKYIFGNYRDVNLKIEQIANNVGRGTTNLSVIFKKETGVTINEFITDLRINRAKELLKQDSYKIYEIAEMVGYGSSQYFSQIFYKFTGMTPNEYKKDGV